jgi:hypothetical protein
MAKSSSSEAARSIPSRLIAAKLHSIDNREILIPIRRPDFPGAFQIRWAGRLHGSDPVAKALPEALGGTAAQINT